MTDQIGELLKLARVGKGWSQDKLAVISGLSQGSISRIESGKQIDLDSLLSVFEALTSNLEME